MTQLTVKDGNNQTVLVEAPLPPGPALAAASKPVVIATDQPPVAVTNPAFGTTGQAAVTDPAGTGTFVQILKGLLSRLRWMKPSNILAITPNDGADLPTAVQALRVYATTETTIKVTPADALDADAVTLSFPPGLTIEPAAVKKVWAQGLTGSPVIHGYP